MVLGMLSSWRNTYSAVVASEVDGVCDKSSSTSSSFLLLVLVVGEGGDSWAGCGRGSPRGPAAGNLML